MTCIYCDEMRSIEFNKLSLQSSGLFARKELRRLHCCVIWFRKEVGGTIKIYAFAARQLSDGYRCVWRFDVKCILVSFCLQLFHRGNCLGKSTVYSSMINDGVQLLVIIKAVVSLIIMNQMMSFLSHIRLQSVMLVTFSFDIYYVIDFCHTNVKL